MATKTVTLNGTEQRVDELGGLNALITNNTTDVLYASAKAGVVPYADGVIEIQSGEAQTLPDSNGTVFLLGSSGRAQLTGIVNFKMPSRRSGGGGVTRAEVNGIVTEKIAEVVANAPEDFDTLKEIADWIDGHEDSAAAMNSEIKANTADISDIQTEQETQNGDISALQSGLSQISNPNLIDNPDFKINQRGVSGIIDGGYIADRWILQGKAERTENGIVSHADTVHGLTGQTETCLFHLFEADFASLIIGKTVTLSAYDKTSGEFVSKSFVVLDTDPSNYEVPLSNGERIALYRWSGWTKGLFSIMIVMPNGTSISQVKLELGDRATPFIPPHPATELLKCQRYYQRLKGMSSRFLNGYGVGYSNTNLDVVMSLPVVMRTKPEIVFDAGNKSAVWDNILQSWGNSTRLITNIRVDQWSGNSIYMLFTTNDLEIGKLYFWQIESGYIELSADL